MSINYFNKLLIGFAHYIAPKGNMNNTRRIIWFFIYIRESLKNEVENGYEFPWSLYVRVANKIRAWANDDLRKAYGLIWDMKEHLESSGLEWNLDTVYRFIPQYNEGEIKHLHEIFSGSDIEDYEREKTKKYME